MRDNFFQEMQFYDKDNVPESIFQKITEFVRSPASNTQVLDGVSKAASHICKWIHAIQSYGEVVRAMQPTKLRISEVQQYIYQVVLA